MENHDFVLLPSTLCFHIILMFNYMEGIGEEGEFQVQAL